MSTFEAVLPISAAEIKGHRSGALESEELIDETLSQSVHRSHYNAMIPILKEKISPVQCMYESNPIKMSEGILDILIRGIATLQHYNIFLASRQ